MWKAVEIQARKIRVAKTEERRRERERGKVTRRKKAKGRRSKSKGKKTMEVKGVIEEWEIWDKEKKAAKSEKETVMVCLNSYI